MDTKGNLKRQTDSANYMAEQKPKSKYTLWREKHPEGLEGVIVNMRAVLR